MLVKNSLLISFCTLSSISIAYSDNLLLNPGFELSNTVANWQYYGGIPSMTINSALVHAGNQAVLLSGRTQTYVGIAQDIINKLISDKGYDVRVWVRTRQNVVATYELGLKIKDGAGIKYIVVDRRQQVSPGKWVKLGGYYRHKPTGTVTIAQLYLNGPAVGVDFYADDAQLEPPVTYVPTNSNPSNFIRAVGRNLVVNAMPVRLVGTNFTAYTDESGTIDEVLNQKIFDREDYLAVKAAGMNVVRLNFWYRLFEDNNAPYVYKQEGWDWLNKQILWAKDAGIYLILDMHAPQCGYQGPSYSGNFWSSGTGRGSCQDRLQSLWVEIARRYVNEPVIASYDLLNEPLPSNNAQWAAYAQKLITAIRNVDANHVIQVESCFADDCEIPPLINDSNVLYDFHHYDHWLHTSQLSYGSNLGDSNLRYGDASSMILPWSSDYSPGTLLENTPIATGNTNWTWYEGRRFTISNSNVSAAIPVFISNSNTGKVTFDDFQIKEYNPAGSLIRIVQNIDIEKAPANPYLLESFDPYLSFTNKTVTQRLSGTSGSKVIETSGHRGQSSISINNANGKYLVKMPNLTFAVRQGYQYQISGWIKGSSATGGTGAMGFQLQNNKAWVQIQPYDKNYLEQGLLEYGFQFSLDHNVPINIGEFGQNPNNYTVDRGGLTWMTDMLDLLEQYGASGQNWNWHSINWGLYRNVYGYPDPDYLNQPLLQLFQISLMGF